MNNKILLAGLIGGVAAFLLGGLFYGVLLKDFFLANSGSATGVIRGDDEMLWGPMVIGHLALGYLIAYVLGKWATISTFVSGLKAGGTIGFLISAAYTMINLGSTHIMNPTGSITDIVVQTFSFAITGGVVGWFLGRGQ
jgi:hypothetical protein